MDFRIEEYDPMNVNLLPPLWLSYLADPSDSGMINEHIIMTQNRKGAFLQNINFSKHLMLNI